ncbi:MAG: RluA family pseudouridine synthase [Candidatus Peregrinibacteria bacterium]|nr:RluA family pseudouridine synthase [Candidatus Peregrinibacteria bacterium]MCB9808234.1 RluA family pseudouridine synthase [Candidatus Peribacteria bacterium]
MTISPDRILYEDEHLLAVNKLSGELVVKGKGKVGKLPLFDFLKRDYPGLHVVHRLDFETSGVVLFAKHKEAEAKILINKFDQWEKKYVTLVMGRLQRRRGAIRTKLPARSRGMIEAETLYTVLDLFGNSSYVECTITTGRHHQIRRHFASIHHPLVLDKEYGHAKFNQLFRQELGFSKFFLHAASLTFPHPMTGKIIKIEAPLPKPFAACIKTLKSLQSTR